MHFAYFRDHKSFGNVCVPKSALMCAWHEDIVSKQYMLTFKVHHRLTIQCTAYLLYWHRRRYNQQMLSKRMNKRNPHKDLLPCTTRQSYERCTLLGEAAVLYFSFIELVTHSWTQKHVTWHSGLLKSASCLMSTPGAALIWSADNAEITSRPGHSAV
jgi:hypothetical protein